MNKKCFTRNRKLNFQTLMVLLLQKSVKSLQLVLNEFFDKLTNGSAIYTATASAFTQARSKLSHTAFIELNTIGIVEPYYEDNKYKKYKGFRLLAVDGSKINLPDEEDIKKEFGSIAIKNQYDSTKGEYACALASVLYDILNNIVIDSILAPCNAYEGDLAIQHLDKTVENDLSIFDRGYCGYILIATHIKNNIHGLFRCSKASFKEARKMFSSDIESKIVTLYPPNGKKKKVKELGLPAQIRVRLVKVILNTGEVEVLLTTLLDEDLYPTSDFKELYHQRWGVETHYGTIKGRLVLENFTGKTPEAIKQDFYSTIFVSNLESVVTGKANEKLEEKSKGNKYKQKVNKAVSFNAIKNNAIELFYTDDPASILEKLTKLFMQNPTLERSGRKVPRRKSSSSILINYHKRIKKMCF